MAGALSDVIVGRGKYLRSTSVRGSGRFGGQNIGIEIIGMRDAQRIPEHLARTFHLMMERVRRSTQAAARAVVPGGARGRLGRQVFARRIGNTVVIGTLNSEFARALDRGFTSKPQHGRALRFQEGGELVFTRRVRVAGRHFYAKWLLITPPIVEATYDRSFYNIKDLA